MALGILAVHPVQSDGELRLLVCLHGKPFMAYQITSKIRLGRVGHHIELPRQRVGGNDKRAAQAAIGIGDAEQGVNCLMVDIL